MGKYTKLQKTMFRSAIFVGLVAATQAAQHHGGPHRSSKYSHPWAKKQHRPHSQRQYKLEPVKSVHIVHEVKDTYRPDPHSSYDNHKPRRSSFDHHRPSRSSFDDHRPKHSGFEEHRPQRSSFDDHKPKNRGFDEGGFDRYNPHNASSSSSSSGKSSKKSSSSSSSSGKSKSPSPAPKRVVHRPHSRPHVRKVEHKPHARVHSYGKQPHRPHARVHKPVHKPHARAHDPYARVHMPHAQVHKPHSGYGKKEHDLDKLRGLGLALRGGLDKSHGKQRYSEKSHDAYRIQDRKPDVRSAYGKHIKSVAGAKRAPHAPHYAKHGHGHAHGIGHKHGHGHVRRVDIPGTDIELGENNQVKNIYLHGGNERTILSGKVHEGFGFEKRPIGGRGHHGFSSAHSKIDSLYDRKHPVLHKKRPSGYGKKHQVVHKKQSSAHAYGKPSSHKDLHLDLGFAQGGHGGKGAHGPAFGVRSIGGGPLRSGFGGFKGGSGYGLSGLHSLTGKHHQPHHVPHKQPHQPHYKSHHVPHKKPHHQPHKSKFEDKHYRSVNDFIEPTAYGTDNQHYGHQGSPKHLHSRSLRVGQVGGPRPGFKTGYGPHPHLKHTPRPQYDDEEVSFGSSSYRPEPHFDTDHGKPHPNIHQTGVYDDFKVAKGKVPQKERFHELLPRGNFGHDPSLHNLHTHGSAYGGRSLAQPFHYSKSAIGDVDKNPLHQVGSGSCFESHGGLCGGKSHDGRGAKGHGKASYGGFGGFGGF